MRDTPARRVRGRRRDEKYSHHRCRRTQRFFRIFAAGQIFPASERTTTQVARARVPLARGEREQHGSENLERTLNGRRAVDYASHSDEDLLRLFYQDDDRAYEELDRRHRHRLAGLARWRLAGHPDADERACEVTQETLLRVVRTRADGLS